MYRLRNLLCVLVPVILGSSTAALQGPTTQQAYLKASTIRSGEWFGNSVAMSGNTLVIGAPRESSGSVGVNGFEDDISVTYSGAAYVFVRNGSTWVQQAYLKPSNTGFGDGFGQSVAIAGDTIVVGAPNEDSAATGIDGPQTEDCDDEKPVSCEEYSGAAYVFRRNGSDWSQEAYLKASNTGEEDDFGFSVAISNDTILVGALGERSAATGVDGDQLDDTLPAAGAAYVFVRNGTTWSQEAYLKASNPGGVDLFGIAVALSGDRAVVGAYGESSSATGIDGDQSSDHAVRAGAAYVFTRAAGVWSQSAYLKASNTDEEDQFGRTVSVFGDTVVVGAPREQSRATGVNGDESDNSAGTIISGAGAVYVFRTVGGTWSQEAYLKASNTEALDSFGASVANWGDTILVGAPGEASASGGIDGDQDDDNAYRAGAAYVFHRSGSTWSQGDYLKASSPDVSDSFGTSVAVCGDSLLVGMIKDDSRAVGVDGDATDDSGFDHGAVFHFDLGSQTGISFCPALPNATGSAALLAASGNPFCDLTLTATSVPNTLGQFFFGPMTLAGNPFGDGLLCVGGMTRRILPMVNAGMMMQPANTAHLSIDYNAPYGAGLTGTKHFQYWFRSSLATGAGHHTSNGLSISF